MNPHESTGRVWIPGRGRWKDLGILIFIPMDPYDGRWEDPHDSNNFGSWRKHSIFCHLFPLFLRRDGETLSILILIPRMGSMEDFWDFNWLLWILRRKVGNTLRILGFWHSSLWIHRRGVGSMLTILKHAISKYHKPPVQDGCNIWCTKMRKDFVHF